VLTGRLTGRISDGYARARSLSRDRTRYTAVERKKRREIRKKKKKRLKNEDEKEKDDQTIDLLADKPSTIDLSVNDQNNNSDRYENDNKR
jgi:hypothetical protein